MNGSFETERTRQWRATELGEQDRTTLDHIEESGCSVVQVRGENGMPGWSYTIGMFDTCGAPELVTVGLPEQTALGALNHAAGLMRKGQDLSVGRHREIVGDVECEFRAVDPAWVAELMHWATWYYGNTEYPVLQLIYPDLENRFPGEEGFNPYFEQPKMQVGAVRTEVETRFWAHVCEPTSTASWKFADGRRSLAFVAPAVNAGTEPVTLVSHDEDGAWQFIGDSSLADVGGPVVVCLQHPVDSDATLMELADLPAGWCAERSAPGEPWVRMTHAMMFPEE